MGHLSNPIGYRIGRTQNWSQLWASSAINYTQQSLLVEGVARYAENILNKSSVFKKGGLLFSHVKTLISNEAILVKVYVYSPDVILAQKFKVLRYLSQTRFFYETDKIRRKVRRFKIFSNLLHHERIATIKTEDAIINFESLMSHFQKPLRSLKPAKWNKEWISVREEFSRKSKVIRAHGFGFYKFYLERKEEVRKRNAERKKKWLEKKKKRDERRIKREALLKEKEGVKS